MTETSTSGAFGSQQHKSVPISDDTLTIGSISVIAAIVCNVLHEGVGHGLTALLTGAQSGVLTTVAWSSAFDSRLVESGGTLVNLVAALVFWVALRNAKNAPMPLRYSLLIGCAFNVLSGTGYFFFSGITNFGDWAVVISGLNPHWLWRTLLISLGTGSYYAAVRVIGIGLVRHVGVPRDQRSRLRKLTLVPYFSTIALASVSALLNPLGIQLLWQSALPATAGGQSGFLWLQYYLQRGTEPQRQAEALGRNYVWLITAIALAVPYIIGLGRGLVLHR
jgi:hypothetical protein